MACCRCCKRRPKSPRPAETAPDGEAAKPDLEKPAEISKPVPFHEVTAAAIRMEIGDKIFQTIQNFRQVANEEFSDIELYLRQLRAIREAAMDFSEVTTLAPFEIAVQRLQVQVHVWDLQRKKMGDVDSEGEGLSMISSRPSLTCAESQKTQVVVRLACMVRDGNRLVRMATKLIRDMHDFFKTLDVNRFHVDRALTDCASHLITWPEKLTTRDQEELISTDHAEVARAADEQITFAWIDQLESMREHGDKLRFQVQALDKFMGAYVDKAPEFVKRALDSSANPCLVPTCNPQPVSTTTSQLLDSIRGLSLVRLDGVASTIRGISEALIRFDGQSFKRRVWRFEDTVEKGLEELKSSVEEARRRLDGLPNGGLRTGGVGDLHPINEVQEPPPSQGRQQSHASTQSRRLYQVVVSDRISKRVLQRHMLPGSSSVFDVSEAIERAGGPRTVAQCLRLGDRLLNTRGGQTQTLESLVSRPSEESHTQVHLTLEEAELKNVALDSAGAQAEGFQDQPLLRHDLIFKEYDWLRASKLEPIPEVARNGKAFETRLRLAHEFSSRKDMRDAARCTFLPDDGVLTLNLPEPGVWVVKVGVTYTPWDKCHGQTCEISLSQDSGGYFKVAGEIATPETAKKGDPAKHNVATVFMDVPPQLACERQSCVRWQWKNGGGRRLCFVYALGYL